MNPYADEDIRKQIVEMQIEVNLASQAANAARDAHSPDYEDLLNEWKALNRELAKFISSNSK